jgi:hypothetical protein
MRRRKLGLAVEQKLHVNKLNTSSQVDGLFAELVFLFTLSRVVTQAAQSDP